MKVILVNGSPKEKGCTYTALIEVAKELKNENIDAEIFHIGNKPISGCISCGGCSKNALCSINDAVNVFLDKATRADGFIFGSPVHFASAAAAITSFMDRAFYTAMRSGVLTHKPAAAIVSCRRGGASAALDQLNKYFSISQMPVVSSKYWNMVHGNTPDEVKKDGEGMQVMRVLGKNMAWLLKCIDAANALKIKKPEPEASVLTNFIR